MSGEVGDARKRLAVTGDETRGEAEAELAALLNLATIRYGCHGIVTHDGEQDACGKPVTVIIDGRGTEAEDYWPACTYHGNRYGGDRVVPLADLLARRDAARDRARAAEVRRVVEQQAVALEETARDAANHYTKDSATGYAIWLWNTERAKQLRALAEIEGA